MTGILTDPWHLLRPGNVAAVTTCPDEVLTFANRKTAWIMALDESGPGSLGLKEEDFMEEGQIVQLG